MKLLRRAFRLLLVFVAGGAAGYYVRDRQQHNELQAAVEQARDEMRAAGLNAIERARQAGGGLAAGAAAAAESTKAAFRNLLGGSDAR